MRGKSHQLLGRYLAENYLTGAPKRCVRAFLIGCIQPDRNPATYLKGSLRRQWLRGHNYENAKRYMYRIARRLERKAHWSLFDYYTMGKLIHYTTDAFTYAHNETFSPALSDHKEYEDALQIYFLNYLSGHPEVQTQTFRTVSDVIRSFHREYSRKDIDIHTDAQFALTACCCVLAMLFTTRIV